jgi:lipid-A-disaccharide synthase
MAKAGVELLYPSASLTAMGLTEVIANLPHLWRVLRDLKQYLARSRPELVVLIDFAGFNFRLAAIAKKLGLKVLYYISPKIWAWHRARARKLPYLVDHMAVLFPFEKDFYAQAAPNLPVTFVGHPLLDEEQEEGPPFLEPPLSDNPHLIGLLPGSRRGEIRRLMPVLAAAAGLIKEQYPAAEFALPIAPGLSRADISAYLPPALPVTLLEGQARAVMAASRLLLIASGTATLQATLAATPMVVIYKFAPLNAFLARRAIKVKYASMSNLILDRPLLPELLQEQATPARLAAAALELLGDPAKCQAMVAGMGQVRRLLGGPGASRRTAQLALSMLNS